VSDPLDVLRRIREPRRADAPQPGERCDLCSEPVPEDHGHVVDLRERSLLCACRGCYLLFTPEGAGGGHYRSVPDRYLAFRDVQLTAAHWDALQIPVSVAFFFMNSDLGRIAAFYPGPAGATESLLSLDTWDDIVTANPVLATLEPDVEAVLLRSEADRSNVECFLVPIDTCYELVGTLRQLWRGFDGGSEAHAALDGFFARVREQAR